MKELLFMKPVFKEAVWGGRKLRDDFGYEIPSDSTGECWGIGAHQGEQGARGKDDEQAAQTGQGPAAPQKRKCHVQDPGGAAWPPRIVW